MTAKVIRAPRGLRLCTVVGTKAISSKIAHSKVMKSTVIDDKCSLPCVGTQPKRGVLQSPTRT